MDKSSYFFSQHPLYCADWTYVPSSGLECVALSTYKEGFLNKLQIVHGHGFNTDTNDESEGLSPTKFKFRSNPVGFDFNRTAEASLDYPATHLQWHPDAEQQRLACLLEALRLYKLDYDYELNEHKLIQTHLLANNTNGQNGRAASAKDDINTFPPVTSFDWNQHDSNIIIASSVNTTCTVWDLNRSLKEDTLLDYAMVKTQLIAHDSEVFDVKFVHKSLDIFALVGNDGSMRLFDLRSLEHSTIIYEQPTVNNSISSSFSPRALLKLATSNVDQHHLATIGVNLNQVIVIDIRMPGIPMLTLDGSLGGVNTAAINLIRWHPTSNYLVTGGDDCQALVWDCALTPKHGAGGAVIDTPILAYELDLEVNNVCWREGWPDWMGVVSGKGFQAVAI